MENSIREQLLELADNDYQKFSAKLLPGKVNILGVRLPELRKLAKRIAKKDWRTYLNTAESLYFEEVMLHGMVIGYAKADITDILGFVADFIPQIDNWSICDSFCIGLKITNSYKNEVWGFLQKYFTSVNEFEVRFAVVMLIDYYIEDKYIYEVYRILGSINNEGYYAKMAVAWALSMCYIKYPDKTMDFLRSSPLDEFTYNKTLQKIVESRATDSETKKIIQSMKL